MAAIRQPQDGSQAGLELPSQVKHDPLHLPKEPSAAEMLEAGLAASNWRYHWYRWSEGTPFDPHARWDSSLPRFEKQCKFLEDGSKFKAFVGGVGSGKTAVGAAETIRFLIEHPGATAIIAAPTYKVLSSSTERTFREMLHPFAIHRQNKTEGIIELTNGSTVFFRSTDRPDLIRGIDAALVWMDEGAFSGRDAWNVLVGRLRQVGFPHRSWVTTTPKGKNWLFDLFVDDESPEQYGWVQVSARDNPHLNEEFIEALEDTYTGRFADQEIEGHFVGLEGLVYPQFNRKTHALPVNEQFDEQGKLELLEHEVAPRSNGEEPRTRSFQPKETLYFVDWGFSNPNVCLLCVTDSDGRMWILDEFYETKTIPEDMGEWVWERWVPMYGKGRMVCDPAEPEDVEKMARLGFNAFGGTNDVLPGIQEMSKRLEVREDGLPRLIVHPRCEMTIKEFDHYRYPDKKEDRNPKEKPVDEHNHAMDALRYGCMELSTGPSIRALDNPDLDLVI